MKSLLNTLLLTLIALLSLAFAQDRLEIHVIDVGQGDSILIRSPSDDNVLVDGGPYDDVALAYLQSIGVEQLDLVIATHPHADHIAGLEAVMRYYKPQYYMDNGMAYTTQTYQGLMEAVVNVDSQLLAPTARRITMGEVVITVLPSAQSSDFETNNNSIGLIVDYGEFQMSLAGDAEGPAWSYWVENYANLLTDVDVHKSSHHGSSNGDTQLTMQVLQPETVIISVGTGNDYGHPDAEALALYEAAGAQVFRTDLRGTIIIKASKDAEYELFVTSESGN